MSMILSHSAMLARRCLPPIGAAASMSAQGAALTGLGRYAEAQPLLTQSAALLSKDGGGSGVDRTLT
jgi:hypothetical protein